MAWVATEKDGEEYIFNEPLIRNKNSTHWFEYGYETNGFRILLPKGTIKKLIGRDLTWEEGPVNIGN